MIVLQQIFTIDRATRIARNRFQQATFLIETSLTNSGIAIGKNTVNVLQRFLSKKLRLLVLLV